MKLSLRSGLFSGLLVRLFFGLVYLLVRWQSGSPMFGLGDQLLGGLFFGLAAGLH